MAEGPLSDLFVTEVANYIAAPAAGAVLADLGARVIHVEHVNGDPYRGYRLGGSGFQAGSGGEDLAFQVDNRGKESIALDLRSPDGVEVLAKLLERSDVMITNLADPQLRTMGLDADSVKAKHPKVIYARINGYGFRGPDKDAESFDLGAFWARSGILQGHAFGDVLPQPRPGVGDHATAISLVAGIILSLLIRERSGEINEARASLLDTAMWMNCLDIAAAGFFGKQPQRRQGGSIPMISAYETADERRIYLQVTHQPGWVEFCSAVGHPEWVGDERFAGLGRRLKYADDLRPLVTEVMKSKPLKEWETIFREKGIPTATINGAFDIHSDEQVAANGHLSKREVGGGSISVVTAPFEVGEPPEGGEAPAAPSHGENGELIMLELGYDWDQIAAFREKGVVGPA